MLLIILVIASTVFILGVNILGNTASMKAGSLIAASGISLCVMGTLLLYRNSDNVSVIQHPILFIVLVAGFISAWGIVIINQRNGLRLFIHLFFFLSGICAIILLVYTLQFIEDSGLVFAADLEEELPGFVFIFSHFGHLEILMMLIGFIVGSISITGSIIGWVRLVAHRKPFFFRGQKWVNSILWLSFTCYVIFIVYNTPVIISAFGFTPTTTDGTKAYSGMYDFHKILIYSSLLFVLFCSVMLLLPTTEMGIIKLTCLVHIVGGLAMVVYGCIVVNTQFFTGGLLLAAVGFMLYLLFRKNLLNHITTAR